MKHLLASSAILLAGATAATAQSGPNLQFSGEVSVESFSSSSGSTETFLFTELAADFGFTTLASGTELGFDLDLYAVAIEGENPLTAVYASVYADFGNHRVSVGLPEGSYGTYRGASIFEASGYIGLIFSGIYSGSLTNLIQLEGDEYAPGIRYDGQFGAFSVSASYNQAELSGDILGIAEVSARYAVSDAFAVWASAGQLTDTGTVDNQYSIGVLGQVGDFEYAATYIDSVIIGDFADVNVLYHVNDMFKVGLGVAWEESASDVMWGASAEYGFADRFFVRGLVMSTGSSDTLTSASIGIKF